jgi:hypothetical protein
MNRNSPPKGLGGFVPDCGPRHIGKAAKQEKSSAKFNQIEKSSV